MSLFSHSTVTSFVTHSDSSKLSTHFQDTTERYDVPGRTAGDGSAEKVASVDVTGENWQKCVARGGGRDEWH
jgi:hypothetical protein